MRDQPCGNLPPQCFATRAVQTQNHKLILGIGMGNPKDALGLILWFWKGWIDFAGIDSGKNKNLFTPDDG